MKRILNLALAGLTLSVPTLAFAASATAEAQQAAQNLGASLATEIKFDKGSPELTQSSRDDLKEFVESAREKGSLRKLKVAAWADLATPAPGAEFPKAQKELAEKRAENVKAYLKESLNVNEVELYNMGQNANSVEKFLGTDNAKLKKELTQSKVALSQKTATALVMAVY